MGRRLLDGVRGHPVAVVIGVGVAIRLVAVVTASLGDHLTFYDSDSYLAVARGLPGSLWSSDPALLEPSLMRPPLYPLFVRIAGLAGGVGPVSTVVAQAVVGGALNVWLAARVAGRWGGRQASVVAALVMALDPVSIAHSTIVASETLFVAWLLVAALALTQAVSPGAAALPLRRRTWYVAASGAALGAAALTRPVGLFLPLVVGLAILVARSPHRLRWSAAFLAPALLLVGGWLVRNAALTDRVVFSTVQGQNLFFIGSSAEAIEEGRLRVRIETGPSWNEDLERIDAEFRERHPSGPLDDSVARSAEWTRQGLGAILDHPRGAATIAAVGVVRAVLGTGHTLLATQLGLGGTLPGRGLVVPAAAILLAEYVLAAWGVVRLATRRAFVPLAGVVLPAAYLLAVTAGPHSYARFRVPVVPFVALAAGAGAVAAGDWLARRRAGVAAGGRATGHQDET